MHGIRIPPFLRSLTLVAALAVAGLGSPRAAAAEPTPPVATPPAPAPPVAGPDDAVAGETPMKEEARAHYDRGLSLYQAKDYAAAIAAFEAGFAIDPRREFLFANAQARRLAGDCRGALPLYQRFLGMSPPALQANATHMALGRCAQQLAAERAKPQAPLPPRPPPPPAPPTPWTHDRLGAVLLATGVVGLAVGGGFLAASYAARTDANRTLGIDEYGRHWDTAVTRFDVAMVGLVGGGALVTAGVLRYAWERHRQKAAATLTVVPGGLALRGWF
jgi:tetratricopeptide (TPR) repeat protein